MNIEEAVAEVAGRVQAVSSAAVIRTQFVSSQEAYIRAYAPLEDEDAIRAATQDLTVQLLTGEELDVQVLVYDIATDAPPPEA